MQWWVGDVRIVPYEVSYSTSLAVPPRLMRHADREAYFGWTVFPPPELPGGRITGICEPVLGVWSCRDRWRAGRWLRRRPEDCGFRCPDLVLSYRAVPAVRVEPDRSSALQAASGSVAFGRVPRREWRRSSTRHSGSEPAWNVSPVLQSVLTIRTDASLIPINNQMALLTRASPRQRLRCVFLVMGLISGPIASLPKEKCPYLLTPHKPRLKSWPLPNATCAVPLAPSAAALEPIEDRNRHRSRRRPCKDTHPSGLCQTNVRALALSRMAKCRLLS